MVMTAAAVMAVLWPLVAAVPPSGRQPIRTRSSIASSSPRSIATASAALLCPAEAEAATAEAARRLLRASSASEHSRRRGRRTGPAPAPRRLDAGPVGRAASGARGLWRLRLSAHPGPARSPRASQAARRQLDLASAIARIETHLAAEPAGWARLGGDRAGLSAPGPHRRRGQGLRGGPASSRPRAGAAVAITAKPSSSRRMACVRRGARQPSRRRSQLDPASPKARFYLARAAEQDGNASTEARADYAAILRLRASDAPWVPLVREQLARLDASRRRERRRLPGSPDGDRAAWSRASRTRLETQGGTCRGMGAADPLLYGARRARQGVGRRSSRRVRPWRRMQAGLQTARQRWRANSAVSDDDATSAHDAASSAASR